MNETERLMQVYGLTIRNNRIVPDGVNTDGTRQFIAKLRFEANKREALASASKPYKAKLLMQNARAARKDADRLERLLQG